MSDPLSVRAFARELGVSHVAVLKAVRSGRLSRSVQKNDRGHAQIVDVDLARQEWHDNAGRVARGARERAVTTVTAKALPEEPDSTATLSDAQRVVTKERARKLRLENDAREGRLVLLDRVKREAFESMRMVRDSLLNLPARLAGELAAETDAAAIYRKLDAEIRQALTSTADALQATVH